MIIRHIKKKKKKISDNNNMVHYVEMLELTMPLSLGNN